jgi:isopenicillin-N epimerase
VSERRAFGRSLLPLWHLEPEGTFLNHGSFGACPREVLAAQNDIREEMERQPDQFFRRKGRPISPENAIRPAADTLARFVGTKGERMAFVTNATEAVTTVLRSVELKPGDEILMLDCVYNAVRLAIEDTCKRTGAKPVVVALPIPLNINDVVERIADAASNRTRLAIIDHIASRTAVVFPVAEITAALKAKGVRVLIDGAHALGHLPLDLEAIGADWYTANGHKWLYTPKGCAMFYAAPDVAARTVPLSVSHWHELGFPLAFDYVGTRDISAFLSVPAALRFVERFGFEAARSYKLELARFGDVLMQELGGEPVATDSAFAAMRAHILPQTRAADAADADALMHDLWAEHRIQIAAGDFHGKLLCRLSAQIYNERADFDRFANVLRRHGWPGR